MIRSTSRGTSPHLRFATALPALALFCICLLATPALADTDIELRNGDSATGTLTADGSAVYRITVPAGSLLRVTAKGKKTRRGPGAPPVRVQVLDAADADLASGRTKDNAKGSKLKKLALPTSAQYRVVLTSEGGVAGNYQVKLSWKAPRKVSVGVDLTAGPAQVAVPVGAGASLDLSVKPGKKSDALPRLTSLVGDAFMQLFDGPAKPSAKKHVVKKLVVPATSDYQLTISDAGAAGGIATVGVKIKPAKVKKRKLRVGAEELGTQSDAAGKVIGPLGGTIVFPPALNLALGGSALNVPVGALPSATPLVIGSAPPITQAPSAGVGGVGPTVFFGPEGQEFTSDVTVTIPFDPAGFEGDFSTLVVVERDAKGNLRVVPSELVQIDALAGTVSFTASHFTSFRVFGPVAPVFGDLNADGQPDVVVPTQTDSGTTIRVYFGDGTESNRGQADAGIVIDGLPADPEPTNLRYGDFDDDGITDLAFNSTGTGADAHVFVVFGAAGLGGTLTMPDDADVDLELSPGGARFGRSLLAVDVTNDGIDDLVVGSPNATGESSVLVYPGGTAFSSATQPTLEFTSNRSGDFGRSVAVGDVNGDGFLDLLVGDSETEEVSVFLGTDDGLIPAMDTESSLTLTSGRSDVLFADRLVVADLSDDGIADVFVADPLMNFVNSGEGRIYVYEGAGPDGPVNGRPVSNIRGVIDQQQVGATLAAGDLDGDGVPDLVVGEPNYGQNGRPGGINVYLGGVLPEDGSPRPPRSEVQLFGEADGDRFGQFIEVRDVTGDGVGDLIVTAPGHATSSPGAGTVYVFAGASGFAPATPADATFEIEGDRRDGAFGTAR